MSAMLAAMAPKPPEPAVPLDAVVRSDAGGDWLVWQINATGPDEGFVRGRSGDGCLDAFIALAGAPLDAFPSFARRYGVLGICEAHGLPGVHASCPPQAVALTYDLFPRVSMTEGWTVPLRAFREPIAAWRALAADFEAARQGEAEPPACESEVAARAAFAWPEGSLYAVLLAQLAGAAR